jgi:hypothetical protein
VTGSVALFAVVGGLAVFLSGGRAVATLPVTVIAGTSASPAPTSVQPTPDPALVAKAGQQYLASATTVNAAIDNFAAAYNRARLQPCSCPAGQFDVGPAFAFEPAVVRDLNGFRETLRTMRGEVPAFNADIDAAIADAQSQGSDLGSAAVYSGGAAASPTLAATYLQLFVDDLARGSKVAAKLRAELGLPPPPLGTQPSASPSGPLV